MLIMLPTVETGGKRFFFDDEDRFVYLAMVREYTERYGLAVWS